MADYQGSLPGGAPGALAFFTRPRTSLPALARPPDSIPGFLRGGSPSCEAFYYGPNVVQTAAIFGLELRFSLVWSAVGGRRWTIFREFSQEVEEVGYYYCTYLGNYFVVDVPIYENCGFITENTQGLGYLGRYSDMSINLCININLFSSQCIRRRGHVFWALGLGFIGVLI